MPPIGPSEFKFVMVVPAEDGGSNLLCKTASGAVEYKTLDVATAARLVRDLAAFIHQKTNFTASGEGG
jgi:hypothetical protein